MTRKQKIETHLTRHLKPVLMDILNESYLHHVPEGSETHFKAMIVSQQFVNLSRVERHRRVMALLAEEFAQGLHALSLHLYTPDEWSLRQNKVPASPACRDGYRHRQHQENFPDDQSPAQQLKKPEDNTENF